MANTWTKTGSIANAAFLDLNDATADVLVKNIHPGGFAAELWVGNGTTDILVDVLEDDQAKGNSLIGVSLISLPSGHFYRLKNVSGATRTFKADGVVVPP